ncbi:MAG: hypothetical protein IT462_01890 [Planctomycetes bacterium]|nr:hypothetical protein [Planctomycetota bacterium]
MKSLIIIAFAALCAAPVFAADNAVKTDRPAREGRKDCGCRKKHDGKHAERREEMKKLLESLSETEREALKAELKALREKHKAENEAHRAAVKAVIDKYKK